MSKVRWHFCPKHGKQMPSDPEGYCIVCKDVTDAEIEAGLAKLREAEGQPFTKGKAA